MAATERMMNRMVLSNLQRRPVRSLVAIIAIAVEVALILLIVGLTNGMVRDNRKRVAGVGADVVVRPSSSSMFFALGGNTMPLQLGTKLAALPGVKAAAPVAMHLTGSLTTIGGIDLASFNAVSGGFQFLAGGPFRRPDQVIVDDIYASSKHLRPGQWITLLAHRFQIAGIFEHGKGSRIYISLNELDHLVGSPDRAAVIYIKLQDPHQTAAKVAQLEKMLPGYTIQPMQQYLSLFTSANMPGLPAFQRTMIGIGVIIGFLVIFLSMYTTILERTREIGILKSLGASRAYIVQAILREGTALALLGIAAGIGLAWGIRGLLDALDPALTIHMTWAWAGWAAGIAIVGSLIGASYPAYKAAAQDPIAALAYE